MLTRLHLTVLLCALTSFVTAQSMTDDFTCDFDVSCETTNCTFTVFPNPTRDFVTIEPPPQYSGVFDVSGRKLKDGVDFSDLPQGIYFLHIRDGDCQDIKKIAKL